MEALLIINSILVAITLYFIKDFHASFKKVAKKVEKLGNQMRSVRKGLLKKSKRRN